MLAALEAEVVEAEVDAYLAELAVECDRTWSALVRAGAAFLNDHLPERPPT
ncbi:hypothetical protein [Phytohabitans suffuscus]|uniref:Uncharacterized protein n=1 Tax=Phytohabitans suffuscus TaxID=624315 RepID=A0A6F8YZD8_9ACTN|nr:hypothetical protein [Phytohabitans suffuscus]BCB91535.1 hypothetical protein Psuf_088480 [Phytohabitans suffuscus]